MSQILDPCRQSLMEVLQPCSYLVTADTPLLEVIQQMSQAHLSCVLVQEQQRLIGIFTERDLVRATAIAADLGNLTMQTCMTQQVITLREADLGDLFTVLNQFRRHQIRHLPVLDSQDRVLGIITPDCVRQVLLDHLSASESRYRAIVETQTALVFRALPDTTLTLVNQAICQISGYPRDALVGRRWLEFVQPQDLEQVQAHLATLTPQTPNWTLELSSQVANGQTHWIQWTLQGLFDPQGQLIELQGIGWEITHCKQTEFALTQAKAKAEAANQAKSAFLANMSHELRTPLNAILGFAQLLAQDDSLAPTQQQQLETINRNGEYLLQLINDILSISKIEAGYITLEESSFDLSDLLSNLQTTFRLRAAVKGVELICDRAPNLPQFIQTDERRLRQILTNLLDNAVKFTDQGQVTLQVRLGHLDSPADPPTLQFTIQDTGLGIAPEDLDTLFDTFVQSEAGRKGNQGSGLGLAICRAFVHLLGGTITVSSQIGIGTTFQFTILLKSVQPHSGPGTPSANTILGLVPNQPPYRVLVADDVSENRQPLVMRLKFAGFEVREARDGQETVALWREFSPQIILLDMRMPIMDGYEATGQIRALEAQNPAAHPVRTKIIAITASVFEEQRQKILAVGCDDFIGKPSPQTLILEKIQQHLGVHYRYTNPAPATCSVPNESQLAAALSAMPRTWVAALHHAACRVSDDDILSLLEEIPPTQSWFKKAILVLVQDFELEQIIHLTESRLR